MGYELIITEKPSQAQKIAMALADTKADKRNEKGVPYYHLTHKGKEIFVACAVGHVYSLEEKEKSFKYPSYDIDWVPAFQANKNSSHTKKYINAIKKIAKDATEFTVATDFDVEGEVIGLNVIRYACKQKDANRMKFSTLTKDDLIKSYANKKNTLEWGQAHAGETRHFLDWMYGINVSRALTLAIKKAGLYKSMSSGRVQGPSLKLIVDKEKEIRKFVPVPYWQVLYDGKIKKDVVNANHKEDKIFDEKKAKKIFEKINKKDGEITNVQSRQKSSPPPTPFDLTTLQTESYRSLRIPPKDTLAVAQELYSAGFISYPRTSSQQLPKELEYKKLLTELLRNPTYKDLAQKILNKKKIEPNNGKKKDPAHPAIYPTGLVPDEDISPREKKLYDLIVRRFLATFSDPATRETNTITITIVDEPFIAKGTRTVVPGWHEFYGPHVKLDEEVMPKVAKGDEVKHVKAVNVRKETQPPKRFTPASLIKELEKRNLGTKSTRAAIIDTLYQRDYVAEKTLEPTEMGIQTSDVLEKFVPEIVNEELTRTFENEMEAIRENRMTEEETINHAKVELDKILTNFKKKDKEIGDELKKSLIESQEKEQTIGECPKCKEGKIMVKYSPKNKQYFLGCSAYPDCKAVFSLPGKGTNTKGAGKKCPECDYPMIIVGKGRSQRTVCFNPDCPTKDNELSDETKEILKKPCEKCGGALVLRKSVYGEFVGCSNYPKCKNIIQIKKKEEPPKSDKAKEDSQEK